MRQDAHAEGDEPLGGADRQRRAEAGVARRQRHQRRHHEHRDDGRVARRLRIGDGLAEMAAQVVVATDALACDEGLRRRLDPMLGLEGVGLLAGREPVVFDLKPSRSSRSLVFRP